ncbi:pyrimidine dimer DNA glycosylase/endonuclease V [Brachybacterium sp. AOP43-C2-M15]|uniref:pyrimidine dimer DNA glycosylase/endonuclease V n=1 Tax=Brachybacterium sp. AOP43-C2-M15 TaxID=3457661 RepID=UPI0040345587
MRLWSLHPRHLDRQGLTGCWREALLAQAVLAGRTQGYRNHPQLERFRAQPEPLTAVGVYLEVLAHEAAGRGYSFDLSRIDSRPGSSPDIAPIPVTDGQLDLEWQHLLAKLAQRSPADWQRATALHRPEVHPLFEAVPGPVESWERAAAPPR